MPIALGGGMSDSLALVAERARSASIEVAAAWKRRSGLKVVGCASDGVPEEIPHAAGCLTLTLDARDVADILGIGASHRCRSSAAGADQERDRRTRRGLVDIHLLCRPWDLPGTSSVATSLPPPGAALAYLPYPPDGERTERLDFMYGEFERLARKLGGVTGRSVSDARLRWSIGAFNRNRLLTRELYDLRAKDPWRLSSIELYRLLGAGRFLACDDHSRLLEDALAEAFGSERAVRAGLRVVLSAGDCGPPPEGIVEALEAAGFQIVEDDLLLGRPWRAGLVECMGPPLRNLARACVDQGPPFGRGSDGPESRSALLLRRARSAGARGVVFCRPKGCETSLDAHGPGRSAVAQEGLVCLDVVYERGLVACEEVRASAEVFVREALKAS